MIVNTWHGVYEGFQCYSPSNYCRTDLESLNIRGKKKSSLIVTTLFVPQGASNCQQTDAEDGKETEGGDDAGRR